MAATWCVLILMLVAPGLLAQTQPEMSPLERSVEELRHVIGAWDVETDLLDDEGKVTRTVSGTYEFSWVVPDRVATGISRSPALQQASGLLLYVNEAEARIEMVSVGRDGRLWVMAGPLGGDQRVTQEFKTATGTGQLRFTRFNVTPDASSRVWRTPMTEAGHGSRATTSGSAGAPAWLPIQSLNFILRWPSSTDEHRRHSAALRAPRRNARTDAGTLRDRPHSRHDHRPSHLPASVASLHGRGQVRDVAAYQ